MTDTSVRRDQAAEHLYLQRGAGEASHRCDANTRFAARDLGEEMLARLDLRPGMRVADVGCGAGQHLLRFAEAVAPGGEAVGYDFSPDAVAQAQARGARAEVADGAALPVPDASFDALASSFAVYYLPDLAAALAEWHRVLRPGGVAAVSGPAQGTNQELYDFHRAVTGHPPSDVDRMAIGYVETEVRDGLTAAGFQDVRVETFDNPIRFPDAEAFLAYWTATSLFIRSVPDGEREDARRRGEAALAQRTEPPVVTKRVAIAVGRRPA
ncbi:MAG TPA: methyltransferase domain-containing protein [Longimicrobium sp.]|nr:methyltransferase domain-containing protein [Longimicrobium sp.]